MDAECILPVLGTVSCILLWSIGQWLPESFLQDSEKKKDPDDFVERWNNIFMAVKMHEAQAKGLRFVPFF